MKNFTAKDPRQSDLPTQAIADQHLRNPLTRVSPECRQQHTHVQQLVAGRAVDRIGPPAHPNKTTT